MPDVKKCPICNGRGIVRNDFYTISVTYPNEITTTGSNSVPVTCRSCDGKGIIFIPDYIPNQLESTIDVNYLNRPQVSDNTDNY